MARPQKIGLDYFPFDVDAASDPKIRYISGKHKLVGFGILVHLLMEVYRNGYYAEWGEMQRFAFSDTVNVDINTISTVLNDCIYAEIFDKNLYEKYSILTSHGIQARYLQACERRKEIFIIKDFFLVDNVEKKILSKITFQNVPQTLKCRINDNSNGVNVDNNPTKPQLMSTKTPQSKVKESKDLVVVTPYNPPAGGEGETDEEAELADKDEATANVFTLFENNIHPITGQIEADKLGDLLDHYGEQWLTEAIKEAVLRSGRSVKYIAGILEQWEQRGGINHERSKTNERGLQSTRRKNQREQGEDEPSESRKRIYANIEAAKNRPKPWEVQRADGQ